MSHRGTGHARRRRIAADYAVDWTMDPLREYASVLSGDFDAVRYDDVLRPALRVRATLVVDENGEPASLTDITRDDVRLS